MRKEEVIDKLRAHQPELKAAGIMRLAVFGSVARGDNTPESDIDLLADFDPARRYTLLTMGRLESRLADLLGTNVDLSSPDWSKESVKNQALSEAVFAFKDAAIYLRDTSESIRQIAEFSVSSSSVGSRAWSALSRCFRDASENRQVVLYRVPDDFIRNSVVGMRPCDWPIHDEYKTISPGVVSGIY